MVEWKSEKMKPLQTEYLVHKCLMILNVGFMINYRRAKDVAANFHVKSNIIAI